MVTVEAFFAAPLTVTAILSVLKAAKRKVTAREYKKLLSAAIAELLARHPNIGTAEARILAAEATGIPPTPELLRAKAMLEHADAYARAGGTVLTTKSREVGSRAGKMSARGEKAHGFRAGKEIASGGSKLSGHKKAVKRKAARRKAVHPRKKK